MMETRLHAQPITAPTSFTSVRGGGMLQRKCACGGPAGIAGDCEGCSQQNLSLQRSTRNLESETRKSGGVPSIVNEVLSSAGQPLDANTRAFMEPRFGHNFGRVRLHAGNVGHGQALAVNQAGDQFEQEADQVAHTVMQQPTTEASPEPAGTHQGFNFADVRIHADAKAAEAAQSVRAYAYTVGSHIVFGAGQYAPSTSAGRSLLAHELTHVVQQGGRQVSPRIQRMDWGPLGGKCCNESPDGPEWALVGDGTWQSLPSGECTGFATDSDGMTCGGGFYYVSNLEGGVCRTPRKDHAQFSERRWTTGAKKSDARSPTQRGCTQGDTPPGYQYDQQ